MNSKRAVLCIFFFVLFTASTNAQNEKFDSYTIKTAKGIDSVYFDLSLGANPPVKEYPFIVITEINFLICDAGGFPSGVEVENVKAFYEAAASIINSRTSTVKAGAYIHQCKRLDYFYVKDTLLLREKLKVLFAANYKNYKTTVSIKPDMSWSFYSYFLFPKADIYEEMLNTKVFRKLKLSSDAMAKPVKLDHWFYFKFEEDRENFITYAKSQNFIPGDKKNLAELEYPLQVTVSREDKLNLEAINPVTIELRKQAKNYHGQYDGWETFVERKK